MPASEYRKSQFEKVTTVDDEYKPRIKIMKLNGETHWINITEQELTAIKTLLTERPT